jgi:molecular chaperone GrpE
MADQEQAAPAAESGPAQQPELPPPTDAALEVEELQRQLQQSKDLLLRKAAEFENYKRRTENEVGAIIKRANEDLIMDILPVVDDLERSLKAGRSADQESFYKGVELIQQKLVRTLESLGVRTFETVGKEFNVDFHDALLQMPRTDMPPHTVIEEVEKGYTLHDRVIRHAKVVVSMLPPDTPAGQQPTPEQ